VVLPQLTGKQPVLSLLGLVRSQGFYNANGKPKGTPGLLSLDITVGAHGAPHGQVWWHGRVGIRITIEIHVIPAQGAGLLGPAASQEAEHDVCVKP